jgi:hypothetical protein
MLISTGHCYYIRYIDDHEGYTVVWDFPDLEVTNMHLRLLWRHMREGGSLKKYTSIMSIALSLPCLLWRERKASLKVRLYSALARTGNMSIYIIE